MIAWYRDCPLLPPSASLGESPVRSGGFTRRHKVRPPACGNRIANGDLAVSQDVGAEPAAAEEIAPGVGVVTRPDSGLVCEHGLATFAWDAGDEAARRLAAVIGCSGSRLLAPFGVAPDFDMPAARRTGGGTVARFPAQRHRAWPPRMVQAAFGRPGHTRHSASRTHIRVPGPWAFLLLRPAATAASHG
jgi:hypothetical protein